MSEGTPVNTHQSFSRQFRAGDPTTRARFDLAWGEAAWRLHRHTLACQEWLATRAPEVEWFEGAGLHASYSGLGARLFNPVYDSHFPDDTPRDAIEAEVDAVLKFYRDRECEDFLWWHSPFAQPEDMADILRAKGLVAGEYHLPAMLAPLNDDSGWPKANPKIVVRPAESRADLAGASLVRRQAFRFAEGTLLTYFEDMAADWLRGDPARLYVAHRPKERSVAAIGILLVGDKLPGVYAMATAPEKQGQGFGTAILRQLMADARRARHTMIGLTAGARAYPLYRRFGFEHLFEYRMFGRADEPEEDY